MSAAAGVGYGTVVENCEVAFNADDGFEFFGGTVNVKYLSALFVGDDAFDSDEGYVGKGQYLFAMTGTAGNHGTEMDSDRTESRTPRSHPAFFSMTVLGGGATATGDNTNGLMRLREATGGKFGNIVLAYGASAGVLQADCGTEQRVDTYAEITSPGSNDYLYFDENNIIFGSATPFSFDSLCTANAATPFTARAVNPGFAGVSADCLDYTCLTASFNPLPTSGSAMCTASAIVTPPASTNPANFWSTPTCSGAFTGTDIGSNWLRQYSWLACSGKMAGASCPNGLPISPFSDDLVRATSTGADRVAERLGGDITTDTTLYADKAYLLMEQLFVKDGVTLTIQPGTMVHAMPAQSASSAAALVVEQGGKVDAQGTATTPITFTTALSEASLATGSATAVTDTANPGHITNLGERGHWGGLIILGKAPTSAADFSTNYVEGIANKPYGGSDPNDDSGTLLYVRVWHGGAIVGADNEINGVTLAGVGAGTTMEHCEVAFNADDGFEFFGGTVNAMYLSVLFVGDDAFDVDEGYQGSAQYLFAMVGREGNHGTEIDSKTNSNFDSMPRSHPAFYSMTIIGGGTESARQSNAIMRLREGTGGKFGNVILVNGGNQHTGVEIKACGSETRTQTLPSATTSLGVAGDVASTGYLYFSSKNIISGANPPFTFDVSGGCSDGGFSAVTGDPGITGGLYETSTSALDPRPSCGGLGWQNVEDVPQGFFQPVEYKGAFGGGYLWLKDWSYLSKMNRLATYPLYCTLTPTSTSGGGSEDVIPGWGVAVFVVIAILLGLMAVLFCVVVGRERSGKPIFMSLTPGGSKSTTGKAVEMNGV